MDVMEELIRLQVMQLRKIAPTQAAIIEDLHNAGFGNSRIAELLGTSPKTVSVAIQRTKKRADKPND